MDKRIFRLKQRHSLYIILASLISFALLGLVIYINVGNMMVDQSKNNAMGLSVIAANEIDGDVFETIRSEDEAYYDVLELLEKYTDYDMLQYIYTMRLEDGVLTFVVDADPENPAACGETYACGGIDSGMPLYMLAGIFTVIPVLKGRHRLICLMVSFTMDIICMGVSYYVIQNPFGFIAVRLGAIPALTLSSRYIDMVCSLLLTSLFVIITTILVMEAYQQERAKREELLVKLDDLSKRDELTGLYNRRELFHFLENLSMTDARFFLCMTDIDHFKHVNDTYGHVFGDVVLRTLAKIMTEEIRTEDGELAARYGGEEFLLVVRAEQKAEAEERINRIRMRFEKTGWENDEALVTTFSGGMVRCSDQKNYAEAIRQADKLLYRAKENGRNRVEMQEAG